MRKIKNLTGDEKFDSAILSLDNHLFISGKAMATRKRYNFALCKFIMRTNKLPEECTKNEIINIILDIQEQRGFQSSTLKHYIYAIRYYLKNVVERMDLFSRIPIPKTKFYDVEILNLHEVESLFSAAKNCRDLLILQLLYETGVRIKELLNIQSHDFDLYHKTLIIKNSKNQKTRIVHFGENLKRTLLQYQKINTSLFSASFINSNFHPFFTISRSSVRYIIKTAVKNCGIQKRVTPHLLRHAFAVHYLNFGGTIYQLQKLLGHSHLTTTFYYLQYAILPESKNISILDKLMNHIQSNQINLIRA